MSAIITIFLVIVLVDLSLAICDRSTLDNITVSYGKNFGSAVQKNFYSLKNQSLIRVRNFNVPVLCEGMISDFPEVKHLFFHYGNLMKIEPGALQRVDKLTIISFNYCLLTKIQRGVFDPIKSLMKIYLIGNHISTIEQGAFSNMPDLHFIDLKDNKITSLDGNIFNGSPLLMDINISQNQISKIHQNAFKDLRSLEVQTLEINLGNNSIEYFDPRSLEDISSPIRLTLKFNEISDYTDIILKCKDESLVDLQNNRISDIPDRLIDNLASRPIDVFLYGNANLPCNILNKTKDMEESRKMQLYDNLWTCF